MTTVSTLAAKSPNPVVLSARPQVSAGEVLARVIVALIGIAVGWFLAVVVGLVAGWIPIVFC